MSLIRLFLITDYTRTAGITKILLKMNSTFLSRMIEISTLAETSVGSFSAYYDRKTKLLYATPKSKKRFRIAMSVMTAYLLFCWRQTWILRMYPGDNEKRHFHVSYGFCLATLLVVGVMFNYNWHHDQFIHIQNLAMNYFHSFPG